MVHPGTALDVSSRKRGREHAVAQQGPRARVQRRTATLPLHEQQTIGIVPEPDIADVAQTADEQASSHEQHDGQCSLHNEQRRPRHGALIRALARTGLENRRDVVAAREQHRRDSSDDCGDEGGHRRHTNCSPVGDDIERKCVAEEEATHREPAPLRDHDSGEAPEQRKDHRLSEGLRGQPPSRHAEREPKRNLAAAPQSRERETDSRRWRTR